jgi:uncharacterized protein (TIGR02594 family)
MSIPNQYRWILNEPGPKMITEALRLFGVKEQPGTGDNPEILSWAKETGLMRVYSSDSIPWCGLFMAVVAKRANKSFPDSPLWALNWRSFGVASPQPGLGDVLVFKRDGGGHVGLYVGEDSYAYHVLGGNQSDEVCFTRILKIRMVAVRRPVWQIAQPANIRRIILSPRGVLSTNEA